MATVKRQDKAGGDLTCILDHFKLLLYKLVDCNLVWFCPLHRTAFGQISIMFYLFCRTKERTLRKSVVNVETMCSLITFYFRQDLFISLTLLDDWYWSTHALVLQFSNCVSLSRLQFTYRPNEPEIRRNFSF